MTEPDAWDECTYCGHDRDDHWRPACDATDSRGVVCDCGGFVDEPAA